MARVATAGVDRWPCYALVCTVAGGKHRKRAGGCLSDGRRKVPAAASHVRGPSRRSGPTLFPAPLVSLLKPPGPALARRPQRVSHITWDRGSKPTASRAAADGRGKLGPCRPPPPHVVSLPLHAPRKDMSAAAKLCRRHLAGPLPPPGAGRGSAAAAVLRFQRGIDSGAPVRRKNTCRGAAARHHSAAQLPPASSAAPGGAAFTLQCSALTGRAPAASGHPPAPEGGEHGSARSR